MPELGQLFVTVGGRSKLNFLPSGTTGTPEQRKYDVCFAKSLTDPGTIEKLPLASQTTKVDGLIQAQATEDSSTSPTTGIHCDANALALSGS